MFQHIYLFISRCSCLTHTIKLEHTVCFPKEKASLLRGGTLQRQPSQPVFQPQKLKPLSKQNPLHGRGATLTSPVAHEEWTCNFFPSLPVIPVLLTLSWDAGTVAGSSDPGWVDPSGKTRHTARGNGPPPLPSEDGRGVCQSAGQCLCYHQCV